MHFNQFPNSVRYNWYFQTTINWRGRVILNLLANGFMKVEESLAGVGSDCVC